MSEDRDIFKEKRNFFIIIFVFLAILISVNFSSLEKSFLSNIAHPLNEMAIGSSESVENFFYIFSRLENLENEYYELQEDYLKLKSKAEKISLLYEEKNVLKQQLEVKEEEDEVVFAQVLYQNMDSRMESLVINKGAEDGISEDDVVVIGDVYIGHITDLNKATAKIRLPTSRASRLKVMILEEDEVGDTGNAFLNGIANGYSNFVKVEQIEPLGDLEEGYSVFVNDSKIGEYLYLGNVGDIDDDPTETFDNCILEIPVEYTKLNYVFVKEG